MMRTSGVWELREDFKAALAETGEGCAWLAENSMAVDLLFRALAYAGPCPSGTESAAPILAPEAVPAAVAEPLVEADALLRQFGNEVARLAEALGEGGRDDLAAKVRAVAATAAGAWEGFVGDSAVFPEAWRVEAARVEERREWAMMAFIKGAQGEPIPPAPEDAPATRRRGGRPPSLAPGVFAALVAALEVEPDARGGKSKLAGGFTHARVADLISSRIDVNLGGAHKPQAVLESGRKLVRELKRGETAGAAGGWRTFFRRHAPKSLPGFGAYYPPGT
ncbi:MAG: hypothetical protein SF028_11665 [Candidatus Sumerlaeia bacterium]|nr:hypothetical protein [Candidatus Sumerlaeia bacterium]